MDEVILKTGVKGFAPAPKVPCRECPLRTDANPGALGGWTPIMYLMALHGPADIACHMSKHFQGHVERDGPEDDRPRSCAGVAAYRVSTGVADAHPLSSAAAAVRESGPEAREVSFDNPNAFILHHDQPAGAKARWWVLPRGRAPGEECGA